MRFLPAILVFGAAGAGYLYTQDELPRDLSPGSWLSDEEHAGPAAGAPEHVDRLAAAPKEELVAVSGPEITNFGDVFRFDLTPQAITSRWSRVSTGLSDVRLQGYRVPLVTGVSESDLAGSLTYYFDGQPRLRRITFLGTTGDPQKLVEFLSRQFGFRRAQSTSPRLTVYRVRFGRTGQLTVAPAEVLDRNQASTNYRVDLLLER